MTGHALFTIRIRLKKIIDKKDNKKACTDDLKGRNKLPLRIHERLSGMCIGQVEDEVPDYHMLIKIDLLYDYSSM